MVEGLLFPEEHLSLLFYDYREERQPSPSVRKPKILLKNYSLGIFCLSTGPVVQDTFSCLVIV